MNTNAEAVAVAAPELQDAFDRLQFKLESQDKRIELAKEALDGLKVRLSPFSFEGNNTTPVPEQGEKKEYRTRAAARIEDFVLQIDSQTDALHRLTLEIESLTIRFQG